MKQQKDWEGIAGSALILGFGVLLSLRIIHFSTTLYEQSSTWDLAEQTHWNGILGLVFAAFVAVPIFQYVYFRYVKQDQRKSWFVVLAGLGILAFLVFYLQSYSVEPNRFEGIGTTIAYCLLALLYQFIGIQVIASEE